MTHRSAKATPFSSAFAGLSALCAAARYCPRTNVGLNSSPFDPLVVHMPACIVQQTSGHPIPVASVLVGQFDDVVGKPRFVGAALGNLALRGSVLTKRTAGTALRHAKLPSHMVNVFPAARRA